MIKKNGFTLIELITVLILLGIISSIALPRFFDQTTFTDSFDRSEFQNALTWARNRAVTTQCTHEVRLTNSGWSVYRDNDDCSTTAIEPNCLALGLALDLSILVSDGSGTVLSNTQPSVSAVNSPQRLVFTATGELFHLTTSPATAGCTSLPSAPVANNTTITLQPLSTLVMDGATAYATVQ